MIPMGTASRLLHLPAPPHDPYSIMLAGHIGPTAQTGWRARELSRVDIDPVTRALVLAPSPATSRWLTEPSGSFGGLRPPANVAVTAAGDVLLLDPVTGAVRRFDPCACRFATVPCGARVVVPCTGCEAPTGAARIAAPRDRLHDPRGIAVCGGDLFIADRGHHRIVRYAIGTWIPRGILRLPPAERQAMAREWEPTGLAVDGQGRLIVTDPINGRVDRFSPRGRWLDVVAVEPGGSHVAVDCDDRAYVVVEREFLQAVGAAPTAETFEIDGGSDGFQWHTLQIAPLGPSARLAIDVHIGDAPWTAAHRDDPLNPQWSPWLQADAVQRALTPLPLGDRSGRFLRVRLSPASGHVAGPAVATVRGARVRRVVGSTTEIVVDARADRIDGLGRPPISVDREGRLHLYCDDGVCIFDARGEPYLGELPRGDRFEREGRYLSGALDSQIEACQWDRIELKGAIPTGCSVEVRATTAEIEMTTAELDDLPDSAWVAIEPARAMAPIEKWLPASCSWDGLLTPQPGRYLWLQFILRGGGQQGPCLTSAVIDYPRVSFRRHLPAVFGMDPAGADFTDRFTAIFDRTLRSIEGRLDRLSLNFDPRSAPAVASPGRRDFLSWLGEWIGIALDREWPEARRRRYIRQAAGLYCQRGTPTGLHRQLLLLLGFDRAYGERCLAHRPRCRCVDRPLNCGACSPCTPAEPPPLLLEHFRIRRWLYAGHGRLGDDAQLWGQSIVGRSQLSDGTAPPSGNAQIGVTTLNTVPDPLRDPFHVFAHKFSVFVPARIRDDARERRALERLLVLEAPAHTEVDIRYVEPRFRVGVQATLGLDSVVARTPSGVTLDASHLRHGTVLSGQPSGPHLQLDTSRVGTTTRLS